MPTRTSHPFKCATPLLVTHQELAPRKVQIRKRDGRAREHCICVGGTGYFSNQKGVMFTCGRDLFRISMTIDVHIWSSIAG